jgi:two-component system LytT family response regulator
MNCVIVDDENSCIQALSGIIKQYCPQLTILGTANNITDAVKLINKEHPQVVFLDVEINNEMGFDLFKFFSAPDFEVVFTTAHEKYALKAIKSSCYDFLLKPIAVAELVSVVSKLESEKKHSGIGNVNVLLDNLNSKDHQLKKIAIPSNDGYTFINVNDIISLEADGKYTKITAKGGINSLSTKNIGEFEEMLDAAAFFRTHKSWIINLDHVKKFMKADSRVQMSNDVIADVSTRKKDDFLKLFSKG